jgi:hypothetical protein
MTADLIPSPGFNLAWRAITAASLLALSACESTTLSTVTSGIGQAYANSLKPAAASPGTAAAPGTGGAATSTTTAAPVANPLAGTELDGLFKKKPITNSNKPERWPRVAITIKAATAGVHTVEGQGTLRPDDCITFDARLWRSASDSQRFENLRLCTPAVAALSKGVAYRTLQLFPQYTVPRGENSTAAQRTDGPVQPFQMFPQDIKSQQQWLLGPWNNKFFLGALFVALGYDWDNDFDRRLWVVTAPLPPT